MPHATQYVVGFYFDDHNDKVVLLRKTHPDWQAGKLNGPGGKIEDGETPHAAMTREFAEETGVTVTDWEHVVTLHGPNQPGWTVYFFRAHGDTSACRTVTDEQVEHWPLAYTLKEAVSPCTWVIPLCLRNDIAFPIIVQETGDDAGTNAATPPLPVTHCARLISSMLPPNGDTIPITRLHEAILTYSHDDIDAAVRELCHAGYADVPNAKQPGVPRQPDTIRRRMPGDDIGACAENNTP